MYNTNTNSQDGSPTPIITNQRYGGAGTNGTNTPDPTQPQNPGANQVAADPYAEKKASINASYMTHTGRAADDQAYQSWLGNDNFDAEIAASPEAQAYKARAAGGTGGQQQNAPSYTGTPTGGNGQIPPAWQNPPIAAPAATGSQPDARYVAGMNLGNSPFATYTPYQFNVNNPGNYQASKFAQFAAPDQSGGNQSQSALMQSILANPETMNPRVVAQMQAANKEQALQMQQQQGQQFDQSAAARGTLGGGANLAAHQNAGANAINSILTGNRGIDMQAASTNRADQLNALGASESLAQGQLGRATSAYNTQLGGQTAQAGENQFAQNSALQNAIQQFQQQQAQAGQGYQGYQSQFNAQNADMQRLMAQFGINNQVAQGAQQNYGQDLQAELGRGAMGNQMNQFNQTHGLDIQKFLESQRQFNGNMGFNYNQLDQQGNQGLLNFLMQSGAL